MRVNIGEKISIGATITNTGDLSGTYEVALKINNAVAETKQVTVDGQATALVTFSITQNFAGTYAVSIDGLSGTFTVETPALTPTPTPTPTPKPTLKPISTPISTITSAPTPTTTSPQLSWWLMAIAIAGIIAMGVAGITVIMGRWIRRRINK
jgi:hypothetical protein